MEKMYMIALTPTMEDGKIAKWLKKESDVIKAGDLLCEVETDKSSMEYESLNEGVILKILIPEGASAKVGDVIAIVGEAGEDISSLLAEISDAGATKNPVAITAPSATATPVSKQAGITAGRVAISPLAKKIAEKNEIDIHAITGTGPGGRIVKRDVESAPKQSAKITGTPSMFSGEDVKIPVSGVRQVIAKRLAQSKFSAPHFYLKTSVRTEPVTDLRNILNLQMQKLQRKKISMNAFFIKFAAEALKKNPQINSSWQESHIVQFGSIDIGLAVDLGNGLMTPIVRNCGNKGIEVIDAELQELIEKVRSGTISAQEYSGATFTISNLGSFGVDEFTAIINPPGAAILAIGQSRRIPVVQDNGAIEVGSVMTLTVSCDHRVIDGSMAARFISSLNAIYENPAIALL